MKESTEFIERLLWFLYRVFFTLIPGVLLLLLASIFIKEFLPAYFAMIENTIENLGIKSWIVFLASVFCMNLVLESFTNVLFYRVLDLKGITKKIYRNNEPFNVLLNKYNPQIYSILKMDEKDEPGSSPGAKKGRHSSPGISLNEGLFNFGLLVGNQKSVWFNNYIWFLISREYLFSNMSLVFIGSALFFFPYAIHTTYGIDFTGFILYQAFQLVFTAAIILYSKLLLDYNYPRGSGSKMKNWMFLVLPVALALICLGVFYGSNKPVSVFLLINFLLGFFCPVLFLRAFREYVHVEYLVMAFFAKEKYDNANYSIL